MLLVILLKLRKYVANDVLSTNVREEAYIFIFFFNFMFYHGLNFTSSAL